jgi:excisionase family DNA binding protein
MDAITHKRTHLALKMKKAHPIENVANGRRTLKIKEVAELLGVTEISVRRLIDRGLLKPCRVFRHVLIPVEQLDNLIKS